MGAALYIDNERSALGQLDNAILRHYTDKEWELPVQWGVGGRNPFASEYVVQGQALNDGTYDQIITVFYGQKVVGEFSTAGVNYKQALEKIIEIIDNDA